MKIRIAQIHELPNEIAVGDRVHILSVINGRELVGRIAQVVHPVDGSAVGVAVLDGDVADVKLSVLEGAERVLHVGEEAIPVKVRVVVPRVSVTESKSVPPVDAADDIRCADVEVAVLAVIPAVAAA